MNKVFTSRKLGTQTRDMTEAEIAQQPEALTEADRRMAWRRSASLSRAEFCIACKRLGILPSNEAIKAAKGDWPNTFDAVLEDADLDSDDAQIRWAAATVVRRLDPLLVATAAATTLTEEQIDAMFGWDDQNASPRRSRVPFA